MFKELFHRVIEAWAIKQIDDGTLHLIGRGALTSDQHLKQMRVSLMAGHYSGAVRIGDTVMVVHSHLLAAVVPLEALLLSDDHNTARWQGHDWTVSWVPQRCWHYEGRLVTQKNPLPTSPALISSEDVSTIGHHVDRRGAHPGEVTFRPDDALEDPDRVAKPRTPKVEPPRAPSQKGWRDDGTWGPVQES